MSRRKLYVCFLVVLCSVAVVKFVLYNGYHNPFLAVRDQREIDTLLWYSRESFKESQAQVSRVNVRKHSPNNYMFALRILEQLTMSTAHFHQFLNLVHDWGFTGVEPFAYGTSLFGLRSLHKQDPLGSVPFNTIFNATMHNDYLSKCMKRQPDSEILFEPATEFIRRSHRRIVLIYFAAHTPEVLTLAIRSKVENEINKLKGPFSDCTVAARTHGMAKYVEDLLADELELERRYSLSNLSLPQHLESFNVAQSFCIKRDIKIRLRDLRNYVLGHLPEGNRNVSIIFISWQGRFTHPLIDSDVKNYINNCRLPFSQPFHSNYIKDTAKRFLNSLGFNEQPYLSVNVRFEKLYFYALEHRKDIHMHLRCCMSRLNSLMDVIIEKFNISTNNILLNWDYSMHGSLTCPFGEIKKCSDIASKYLNKVKAKRSFFDPKKFNLPSHHSIVSLVELETLLGGKTLVTVGGGSYQATLIETYKERHHDPGNPTLADRLHYGHLCIPPEDLHGLKIECT